MFMSSDARGSASAWNGWRRSGETSVNDLASTHALFAIEEATVENMLNRYVYNNQCAIRSLPYVSTVFTMAEVTYARHPT